MSQPRNQDAAKSTTQQFCYEQLVLTATPDIGADMIPPTGYIKRRSHSMQQQQ